MHDGNETVVEYLVGIKLLVPACSARRSCFRQREDIMSNRNPLIARSILACVTAAVVGHGIAANAADPEFTLVLPAGIACEFELQLDVSGGKLHFREFKDPHGGLVRTLFAGKGFAFRFTNTATGTTLETRSNGIAAHATYNADGSFTQTDTGHTLIVFFPTDSPPGPSTTLITGRLVFTVDALGVGTLISLSGKETDVCAALS
jgi:hypothetical protein